RRITLAPGGVEELVFALGAGASREETVAMLERLREPAAVRASRAGAAEAATERARRLGLSLEEALELERLGAALRYGDPRLAAAARASGARGAPGAGAELGIPAGVPLVLVEDA